MTTRRRKDALTRQTYTVDPLTLEHLQSAGNASGYLRAVMAQRAADTHAAFAYLLDQGWTRALLREAMEALPPGMHAVFVRDLREQVGGALNRHVPKDPEAQEQWLWAAAHGADWYEVARALLTLAEERWAGNEALDALLGEPQ